MHQRLIAFLERRPAVRWLLYLVLGAGIFVIGASYLRLQIRPDPVGLQVTGGDLLARGWPATFRIRARTAHLGRAHAVHVRSVKIGDQSVQFTARDADPLTLTIDVPNEIEAGALQKTLALELEAAQTRRTVSLAIAMTAADPGSETPMAHGGGLSPTRRTLRIELHPEAGDLVSHLDNRVFVRARSPDGKPVAGATITLSHADFVGGQTTIVTDGAGLGSFLIKPRLPNFDVRITAASPENPEIIETFNETLYAVGRQLMFDDLPPIITADRTHAFRIQTTRDNGDVFCDLRRGRTHILGLRLPIGPTRDIAASLPPLPRAGRYDLQCYLNILIPGTTAVSRAFWVGDPRNPEPVLESARRSGLFGARSLEVSEGSLTGHDSEFTSWLTSRLGDRGVLTEVLAQTFESAVREADAAWEDAKSVALATLGLAIFLVLLVGLDLVLQNILSNRRRFRAYEAALADEGALGDVSLDGVDIAAGQSTDRLSRTRGWLFMIVAVGTLLANIVGFLMLSGMFRS